MAESTRYRKVLVVGEERAIKNLLSLVRKLDSRRVVAGNRGIDLSTISRQRFDTAIMDVSCSDRRPACRGYGFGEVWASMVGKVLVINAEVNDRETLQMVEQYIYHRHSLQGFLFDLSAYARVLLGSAPSPTRI